MGNFSGQRKRISGEAAEFEGFTPGASCLGVEDTSREKCRIPTDPGCEGNQRRGRNRLSDLHCALGWSQLQRLDAYVARRRQIAQRYHELLADVPHVRTPFEASWATSSYHLYVVQIDFVGAGLSRKELFDRFRRVGIGLQVHYIPVHLQPYYRQNLGTAPGDCPVAEAYYERAGWDIRTGVPTRETLEALDLAWVADEIASED